MPLYEFQGIRPTLGRDVFIAPGATVIGDVELGDESSVWFGSILRGDVYPIRLGRRTNLQDASVVHVSGGKAKTTVGDDVTIGHMALLHGCTIGHGALIGMGSTVLDLADIGDECIVAAGSLVAPGTRLAARSFVMGRPARVVRAVTDADLVWVREASAHYVQYARTFRSNAVKIIGDAT
jgi:carbonic anhydrase/acetyltransferase-like protein (isoleucine patch superfamily)